MTELKTLKDIPDAEDTYYSRAINENKLKAEAVKWAKYCEDMGENIVSFIEFFNLTKEDLK